MRNQNTYLKLIVVLSLLGILVSGWLLSMHIKFSTGQAGLTESCTMAGVSSGEGCANVAVSEYSDLKGVPLAALAMGFYFSLILLVFWAMRNFQAAYEPLYVGFFLSTISIVVTVVMFYLSRFVLHSFCVGCAMLWLINLAIWPCFVKHLGLSWANALGANLELVRHKALNLRRERVLSHLGAAAICVLIFAVIGAVAKAQQGSEVRNESSALLKDFQDGTQVFLPPESIGGPSAKGLVDGNPVMDIVEFADFQCPGCKSAAQLMRPFLMKHKDKVRITFRSFPLDGSCNALVPNGSHRMSCAASRTAICAGRQGKFWEMHDLLFDNQDSLSDSFLDELVAKAGLDLAALQACRKDPATETQLQKEIQWGDLIQLQSTPTIIINGRKTVGARTPADLEALLYQLEKEKK